MSNALSSITSQHSIPDGAVVLNLPLSANDSAQTSPGQDALLEIMRLGWIKLDGDTLRRLRLSRFMSQQDLANDCWHRDIRVSIATIKRAECGHAVRFRIARELARCFDVPVIRLVRQPD